MRSISNTLFLLLFVSKLIGTNGISQNQMLRKALITAKLEKANSINKIQGKSRSTIGIKERILAGTNKNHDRGQKNSSTLEEIKGIFNSLEGKERLSEPEAIMDLKIRKIMDSLKEESVNELFMFLSKNSVFAKQGNGAFNEVDNFIIKEFEYLMYKMVENDLEAVFSFMTSILEQRYKPIKLKTNENVIKTLLKFGTDEKLLKLEHGHPKFKEFLFVDLFFYSSFSEELEKIALINNNLIILNFPNLLKINDHDFKLLEATKKLIDSSNIDFKAQDFIIEDAYLHSLKFLEAKGDKIKFPGEWRSQFDDYLVELYKSKVITMNFVPIRLMNLLSEPHLHLDKNLDFFTFLHGNDSATEKTTLKKFLELNEKTQSKPFWSQYIKIA